MKQMMKSSVGPRLIGKSLESNTFEVERGIVSQAPGEEKLYGMLSVVFLTEISPRVIDRRNLDLTGMWFEAQTK